MHREALKKIRALVDQARPEEDDDTEPSQLNDATTPGMTEGSHVKLGSPERREEVFDLLKRLSKRVGMEYEDLNLALQRYLCRHIPTHEFAYRDPQNHNLPDISGYKVCAS